MVDGKVRFGEERIGMVKVFLFLPFLGSKYNTTWCIFVLSIIIFDSMSILLIFFVELMIWWHESFAKRKFMEGCLHEMGSPKICLVEILGWNNWIFYWIKKLMYFSEKMKSAEIWCNLMQYQYFIRFHQILFSGFLRWMNSCRFLVWPPKNPKINHHTSLNFKSFENPH